MGKQKDKNREKRAQQKKEKHAQRRAEAQQRRQAVTGGATKALTAAPKPFDPPRPATLGPPVYVTASGETIPDPHTTLGLTPGERDPEVIRRAWRQALIDHPPEQDPEGSRLVREARDRLLEPTRLIEREVGVLRAPDPAAWRLPTEPPPPPKRQISLMDRMTGQAVLYALVEDELTRLGAVWP